MMEKKSRLARPEHAPELPVAERGGFAEVLLSLDPEAARREAARCLDCDEVCSLCVTVCPNRANQAYTVPPLSIELPSFVVEGGRAVPKGTTTLSVEQGVQIVNLGDACNECGNCVTFCPTSGAPYRDKPTFWIDPEGFAEAKGDAFRMTRSGEHRRDRREDRRPGPPSRAPGRRRRVPLGRRSARPSTPPPGRSSTPAPSGTPAEGDVLDLGTCALLIALLHAEPALPPLSNVQADAVGI